MNQTPMNQPMGMQPKPAVSKWLWITLIIVVLIGGGFFSWYFLMGPGKDTPTTAITTPTTTDPTANWKTYSDTTYVYSIKYPTTYTAKAGITSALVLASENFLASGEDGTVVAFNVSVKDLDAYAKSVTGFTDKTLVGYVTSINKTATQTTTTFGGQSAITVSAVNPDDSTKTLKVTYVLNTGKIYEITENYLTSDTAKAKTYSDMLSTFKFTTATSADWKAFSNTAYGFGLTLTNAWQKYRYQIVLNQNGATATIYFSLPTTDTKYASATTKAPAGYAPVFHINAFPVATYSANSIGTDTFITKSTKYDFTWGKEATVPTDVAVQAITDEATIISSFKLSS